MYKDVGKRIMALLLSVCMIAGMVDLSGFTVHAANNEYISEVKIKDGVTFTYSGAPIKPTKDQVEVWVENETTGQKRMLNENEYRVDIPAGTNVNVNAGTNVGTVYAYGEGDLAGEEGHVNFTIEPKEISECQIIAIDKQYEIAGVPVTPVPTIIDGQKVLQMAIAGSTVDSNIDYVYDYNGTNVLGEIDTSKEATISIEGKNNYQGNSEIKFTMERMDPDLLTVELQTVTNGDLQKDPDDGSFYLSWNGSERKPAENEVVVKYKSQPLANSEYELIYDPQIPQGAGDVEISVKGKGNQYGKLTGTEKAKYNIKKMVRRVSEAGGITIPEQNYPGKGKELVIDPDTIRFEDPDASAAVKAMNNSEKFTITNVQITQTNGKYSGTATITGIGKYYGGTLTGVRFDITAEELTASKITVENKENIKFDGTTDWLNQILSNPGTWIKVGDYDYGDDYVVEKDPLETKTQGINAGDYKFIVKPTDTGRLLGNPVPITITVLKKDINDAAVSVSTETYIGPNQQVRPTVNITYVNGNGISVAVNSSDYSLKFENAVNAGNNTAFAIIEATASGNFTGSKRQPFTIRPKSMTTSNTTITGIKEDGSEEITYVGNDIEPALVIMVDNQRLELNKGAEEKPNGYTIEYSSNNGSSHKDVKDGTITMTIRGQGNYEGTFTRQYTITQRPLDANELTPTYTTSMIYEGQQITQDIILERRPYGTLTEGIDYRKEFGENKNVGTNAGSIIIKAVDNPDCNYSNATPDGLVYRFDITSCNLGSLETLGVTAKSQDESYDYDLVEGTKNNTWKDNYYIYTGGKVEPKELKLMHGSNPIDADDYEVECVQNTGIGEAHIIIRGTETGNYSGSRTLKYAIKGNLEDWRNDNPRTSITIPRQIYSAGQIVPQNVNITFREDGKTELNKLKQGEDFTVENIKESNPSHTTGITPVGEDIEVATIKGQDFYVGTLEISFSVDPLNLSDFTEEQLKDPYKYVIDLRRDYTYSGLDIEPDLSIKHNEHELTDPTDYTLEYYGKNSESGEYEKIEKSREVGTYKVRIIGSPDNYKGYKEKEYTIEKYDLPTGVENGKIEITGTDDSVVLDQLKYPNEYTDNPYTGAAEMKVVDGEATDQIVWKSDALKVMYTPVDIDGNPVDGENARPLVEGQDYVVRYENNTMPGEATLIIEGINNFDGEITKPFDILADLGNENHTKVSVENCKFTPAGADKIATNRPVPTVEYTVDMVNGDKEPVELVAGTDYEIDYENNGKATAAPEGKEDQSFLPELDEENKPRVKITAKEGTHKTTGENKSATFEIYQRELDDEEEVEGKKVLVVDPVNPEGYEFINKEIVPELGIMCNQIALVRKTAETGENYDYDILAVNNLHVYTFNDAHERQYPVVTVFAKRTEEGLYTGNYFGEVPQQFEITAREISEATIDTNTKIENLRTDLYKTDEKGEWYCEYTRKPINFPEEGDPTAFNPIANGLVINWNNGEGDTLLKEGMYGRAEGDYSIQYKDNNRIGKATILIQAQEESDYKGSYEKYFGIKASITEVDNPSPADPGRYMELSYNDKVYYGIVPVYPDLRFEDKSGVFATGNQDDLKILTENEDFEIVTESNQNGESAYSQNNIEVSTEDSKATVVVRGKGYYTGAIDGTNNTHIREYTIVPKDFTDEKSGISVEFVGSRNDENYTNAYVYTGQQQRPEIRIYNNNPKDLEREDYDPYGNSNLMLKEGDYRIVDYINNTDLSTDTVKAGVIIEGTGKNYTGRQTFWFTIIPQPMEDVTCQIKEPSITYDGTAKEPELEVFYTNNEGRRITLTEEVDYDVEYINNVDAATSSDENPPTIILTGKGGYGGENQVKFTISPKNLQSEDIQASGSAPYANGGPVKANIKVTDTGAPAQKAVLVETEDYDIISQSEDIEIGATGTITIEGKNNYSGTRNVEFRIFPPNGTMKIEPIMESYEYNAHVIRPKVTVNLLTEDSDEKYPLTEGVDYDVVYSENQNAGVGHVTVVGKDIFLGKQDSTTFAITPKSIGSEEGMDPAMTIADIQDVSYTGSAITPVVSLSFQPPVQSVVRDGDENEGEETNEPVILVAGRDYTVTAVNNTMVGTATATITGIGNYSGAITREFRILGNMNMVTIAPIPMQDYTGNAVTPEVQVSLGGKALTLGRDYTVEYKNNVDRGTASVILTGVEPWYTGTRTVTFDIARELSAETSIRGVAAVYTYTGAAITPPVRVEDDGNLLVSGVDYDIAYSENVNAGTATITITGKGKYTGGTKTTFQISPQQLGRATVSPISDQVYTGKEQNPPITVTSGNTTLQKGTDYSVVYVNSATPGMASVIIKGEGNYTGTQTVNYNIKVPEITGAKVSKYTNKSVTLSWTKNDVVSGYEIYNSGNRRAARVNKPTTVKATVSKLKAGTSQTFRVRAYVNKDGQYYYGPFASVKAVTAPNSTKIKSLKSSKKKQVAVKWKKVSGATQYEVYRSTSKKGKYKKLATTKKTSYTDKKATGGKKYYYKIRVCKKIDKKNYYSSYSAVKSVKAKK